VGKKLPAGTPSRPAIVVNWPGRKSLSLSQFLERYDSIGSQTVSAVCQAAVINRVNEWNAGVRAIGKPPGWRTVTGGILQKGEASGKMLNMGCGIYVRSKEEAITGQKKRRGGASAPSFAFNQHRPR